MNASTMVDLRIIDAAGDGGDLARCEAGAWTDRTGRVLDAADTSIWHAFALGLSTADDVWPGARIVPADLGAYLAHVDSFAAARRRENAQYHARRRSGRA